MSKLYEFAISRKLSIVLALCCALTAILLFVAGTMSGLLLSPHYMSQTGPKSVAPDAKLEASAKSASTKPEAATQASSPCATPSPAPAATAPAQTASAGLPKVSVPQPPSVASATGASTALKADGGAAAATSATGSSGATSVASPSGAAAPSAEQPGTSAKAAVVSAAETYPISLAVQVGSFLVEDNATRLAQSLKQLGYPAEIVQRLDARQRTWYVVRLGPYHKWDTASGVALRLASNQDLQPVVGPM